MAAWNVRGRPDRLICHADHGSIYTAMVYADRVVELSAAILDGGGGHHHNAWSFPRKQCPDSHGQATTHGIRSARLIRRRSPVSRLV
ncbi:hypothetical protein [uncultured Microbacterium sp.]|uniref:hypothetical protein n=1 Tax=uncultured Microbacterium sp. TaxID=191216 RepID=UPI0025D045F1|nr:hypothetical protein [uncultured Microbacterium sp.]